MPSRNRAREQARAEAKARGEFQRQTKKKVTRKRTGPKGLPDPSDTPDSEIRFITAAEASKAYLCPGCNREIPQGLGHLVAVPPDAPDLRRHWHRGCWERRSATTSGR